MIKEKIYILIFLGLCCLSTTAREKADSAYLCGDFSTAIQLYEQLLPFAATATNHYNLANAYYRTNDIGHAVLHYERALLLAPYDSDIRHNLEICRKQTSEESTTASEMFFVTLLRDLRDSLTTSAWALVAYASCFLSLLSLLLSRHSPATLLRKVAFIVALLSLILTVTALAMGAWRNYYLQTDARAVVLTSSPVYSAPDKEASAVTTLLPGTIVETTPEAQRGYVLVRKADGAQGWVTRGNIERIRRAE